MKHSYIAILIISIFFSCKSVKDNVVKPIDNQIKANVKTYAETITQNELKQMLYIYASDEFEGRDTGEKGQKLAVNYLKNKYIEMDIASPKAITNYFQKVPLKKQAVSQANITVNNKTFKNFEDHVLLALPNNLDINAKTIVYAGYGIDDHSYSDYKNIDVKNKIVLVKAGEPKDANGNYLTTGDKQPTKWTSALEAAANKREAAIKHGAKMMLYLDTNLFEKYAPYLKQRAINNETNRIALQQSDNALSLLLINSTLAKALHANIVTDDKPKILQTNLKITATDQAKIVDSENVIAYIKGSEKPDEYIVLSAHLDHVGIQNGKIHNGADDDGSGTVALLEIAQAFKMAQNAGYGPKRSVVFLHVTGEEKGLLGSQHYTDNDPIFPLKNTVANLNIDMIGRTDPKRKQGQRNYLYLIGSDKLSTELHQLSETVNSTCCNIELDYKYNDENDPNRFYYRSDHYNFAKNNIPVIFYFNGTHADYHRPTDTADKIEYDLLENRTRLIFYTAWELANRKNRIVVDKVFK